MNRILVISCENEKQASKMGQLIHKQLDLDYDIFASKSEYNQFCPYCSGAREVWGPNFCTSCKQDVQEHEWATMPAKFSEEYKRGWEDGSRDKAVSPSATPPWERGARKSDSSSVPKKAMWSKKHIGPGAICSACGGFAAVRGYSHCPNCGAEMEEERKSIPVDEGVLRR